MFSQLRIRFPLLALGLLALLAGLWAGLVRLGWGVPPLRSTLIMAHGPLMVSGFLGTLITLERAVALRSTWAYASPLLTGLGAVALIVGLPDLMGPLFLALGSFGLTAIFAVFVCRQPTLFMITMALGALSWLVGNALWLAGWPIFQVILWWAGFLILTIVGERLELSRLLSPPRHVQITFLTAVGLLLAGLIVSTVDLGIGVRLAGLGMIALALWLGRYDIARRTVRQEGLPRFVACALLAGYIWLGASGLMGALFGSVVAGFHYDALLHALFLGFVFSMIFGHAPIIFPAILGLAVHFKMGFYSHLLLLHLALLLRVVGDLVYWLPGWQWGGLLNVAALLLFLVNTARSLRSAKSEGTLTHA